MGDHLSLQNLATFGEWSMIIFDSFNTPLVRHTLTNNSNRAAKTAQLAMPAHSEDEAKAARKAVAKASLARAKQWSEDQRRMKSPVTTTPSLDRIERDIRIKTSFAKESPKKDPPVKKNTQTRVQSTTPAPADVAPDIQYRKTPSRVDRAQARAKARQWNSERKKLKPNSKAGGTVPAIVETKLTEVSSDCDEFETAHTTDRTREDLSVPAGVFLPEAHVKELSSIKNDFKKVQNRLETLYVAMNKNGDSDENMDID